DVEAGVVEEGAVVVDGVVADYGEAAGALGMELEGEEGEGAGRHGDSSTLLGETSTGADDAGEFAEGGGLVGGVLEGVNGHGGVHRGGLEAGFGEAADGEARGRGEAEGPGALFAWATATGERSTPERWAPVSRAIKRAGPPMPQATPLTRA